MICKQKKKSYERAMNNKMISTQGRCFFPSIYLLSFYKKAENSIYIIIGISVTFDKIFK